MVLIVSHVRFFHLFMSRVLTFRWVSVRLQTKTREQVTRALCSALPLLKLLISCLFQSQWRISWIRPDGKSQVSVVYEDGMPKRIDTVVISTQHSPDISMTQLREEIINKVIKPVCESWIDSHTKFFVNPTGRFVIGGPPGDTGLTGRKIIDDTYGGMGRHGGGAFSGKDPSKVDRSACYMARY